MKVHYRHSKQVVLFVTMLLLTSLVIFSCDDDNVEGPSNESRIIIGTDLSELSARIEYKSDLVEIDTSGTSPYNAPQIQSIDEDTLIITLVAEVAPPTHDGISLQATDVSIQGNKAYVSYNVRGETFLGGVDVFSINNRQQPSLESSIIFTDTDVNGIYQDGNYLYLASAKEPVDLDSPAILERIRLQGGIPTDESETIDLASYAGTDVTVSSNKIYATSGADDGAVSIISKNNFNLLVSFPVEDARGVDVDNDMIGVVAGTPARLLIFEDNIDAPLYDYTLTGATIDFSKSTIELVGGKAILAVGNGGMQAVCSETGAVIESFGHLFVPGLPADATVTNAASVDGKLMFMSNGEAGVYVASSDNRFDSNSCEIDNLQMLGHFRFDEDQSVNHVAYKNGVLFIASGLGGLKICTVEFGD
jgi:hypothetical protein